MGEAGKIAPIGVESPQRNEVERGLATESGEPVCACSKACASNIICTNCTIK